MKTLGILTKFALVAAMMSPIGFTAVRAQAASAAHPAHYLVGSTLVSTLLADPAAVAILKRLIPTIYANDMFQQNAGSITVQDVQQYEPEALSNANLAKIQAEFDKIPAKG